MLFDDENCDNGDSMGNDETCDNPNLMSNDNITHQFKAIKSHTGYPGCGKCTRCNRITFPENNAPCRSDLFQTDEDHHTGISPLADTSIDMVHIWIIFCFSF